MRKGYKITLSVLTIMILITITIGTSYSYYSVSDVQSDPNTLASTCFNINYTDNNVIKLNNTYPMSETNALRLTPYSFTIENTCDAGNQTIKYDISLNTLTTSPSTLTSSLNYKLNRTAPTAVTGTTGTLTTPYALNPNVKTSEGVDSSYALETGGTLAPGESKTYNLYLWINENAGNDIMAQTFTGKVLVYSYL